MQRRRPAQKQLDLWEQTIAPGADGWLGSTGGVTDDGTSVAVVRFESRGAGRRQLGAARAGRVVARDGQPATTASPSFRDYDDAFTMLDGGSDDAGFVQVMQGRVDDADGVPRLQQAARWTACARCARRSSAAPWPIADDGDFTQTIYFTSEAAAREGEKQEMPEEVQARDGGRRWARCGDITYFDLADPWFAGGG